MCSKLPDTFALFPVLSLRVCPRTIKVSLLPLYPRRCSREKIYQALSTCTTSMFVFQSGGAWNEATVTPEWASLASLPGLLCFSFFWFAFSIIHRAACWLLCILSCILKQHSLWKAFRIYMILTSGSILSSLQIAWQLTVVSSTEHKLVGPRPMTVSMYTDSVTGLYRMSCIVHKQLRLPSCYVKFANNCDK